MITGSILQRIAEGDTAAVSECLTRYGGLVWSLARRLSPPGEAEDAVQEIFIELWRNAGRFDAAVAPEGVFVAMIARRKLIDRRRKMARRPAEVELPAAGLAATDEMCRVELGDEAQRAAEVLQELRPDERRVLELSVYSAQTHEEIARTTGLPLGTVKTHVRRGLEKLRSMLARSAAAVGGLA